MGHKSDNLQVQYNRIHLQEISTGKVSNLVGKDGDGHVIKIQDRAPRFCKMLMFVCLHKKPDYVLTSQSFILVLVLIIDYNNE